MDIYLKITFKALLTLSVSLKYTYSECVKGYLWLAFNTSLSLLRVVGECIRKQLSSWSGESKEKDWPELLTCQVLCIHMCEHSVILCL